MRQLPPKQLLHFLRTLTITLMNICEEDCKAEQAEAIRATFCTSHLTNLCGKGIDEDREEHTKRSHT